MLKEWFGTKTDGRRDISYEFVVRSFIYVQTCPRLDISIAIGVLGRYHINNQILNYCKVANKILRLLQETKNHMLTYRKIDHLEVSGNTNSDFADYVDIGKSTFGYASFS